MFEGTKPRSYEGRKLSETDFIERDSPKVNAFKGEINFLLKG
jgi:hypothetical protein